MIELPPALETASPSTLVRLHLKAEKLRDRDYLTKSDPCCVVFKQDKTRPDKPWKEVGRTEMIRNDLSPEWARPIAMEYFFEERQPLRFEVYDIDSENSQLDSHDFLGFLECDLAEIVSNETYDKPLKGLSGNCGRLIISCDEVNHGDREIVVFDIRAEKVERKDFFGLANSDPYLNIYRLTPDGSRRLMHRTEFIRSSRNPKWKKFEMTLRNLCDGDKSRKFLIECWDNDEETLSTADFIGSAECSVEELINSESEISVELINIKKKNKKGKKYKNSGILYLKAGIILQNTFVDFISGGTQLDFVVAVDFTASNGLVHNPGSLHYINPNVPNQYEIAIRSVLEICQFYNNNKKFEAYGFGACMPPGHVMIPLFDLSDPKPTSNNPTVIGINGVLTAYRTSLNKVTLFGPTKFSPIVQEVAKKLASRSMERGARYQILLIITDGVINDLAATKKMIIESCHLPLSIIIVGVGDADFSAMDELDGDGARISLDGRMASRDIVQFVPLRNFQSSNVRDYDRLMAMLAKEVLAEVPAQLVSYMRTYNVSARPASNPYPKDRAEQEEVLPDVNCYPMPTMNTSYDPRNITSAEKGVGDENLLHYNVPSTITQPNVAGYPGSHPVYHEHLTQNSMTTYDNASHQSQYQHPTNPNFFIPPMQPGATTRSSSVSYAPTGNVPPYPMNLSHRASLSATAPPYSTQYSAYSANPHNFANQPSAPNQNFP